MRRLLDPISARLEAFVRQPGDLTLVLAAPASDAMPLLTMLEGIEARNASDFFWTFTEPFTDAASYADALVRIFADRHRALQLLLQQEGMPPWPELPAEVQQPTAAPARRLRALAAFSRELLPIPNGGICLWTLFPLEVADASGFAALARELVAHEFPFPWCHHLRFIVRDDPAQDAVSRLLGGAPRTQRFAPDLGADALNRSIESDVADPSLPLAERMGSLLLSAGNDLAFGRLPSALEKFSLLLQYHAPLGNQAMAAVALNGMGQVWERMGDLAQAERAYQDALVPASHAEPAAHAVFLNAILSLAKLRVTQERWAEAEGYWDAAQQLATVTRDGPMKVRALEQLGICRLAQGKRSEAIASWRAGSVIAAQLEDTELCGNLLARLHRLFAAEGQADEERLLREQLAGLGRAVEV
jgi:tetratricopeptide (TPR) repeat protein